MPEDRTAPRLLGALGLFGLAGLLSAPLAVAQDSPWLDESSTRRHVVGIHGDTLVIEHGIETLTRGEDSIRLHRYERPGSAPNSVLLYLPGTNMNGSLTADAARYDLWLYLAEAGVVVYALDYRTHAIPPTDDAATQRLGQWTMDAFVADARAALDHVADRHIEKPTFVAGFSRGVSLGYGLLSTTERELAGFIVLDGGFKSPRSPGSVPDERPTPSEPFGSDVAAGIGWERRDALMRRTMEDASGPALEGLPGGPTIGEQLRQVLYGAWRPGGLSNALNGLSEPRELARLLAGYDRYYPSIQNAEGARISSHADARFTPLDDRFGEIDVPILYFGAAKMGAAWLLDGLYSAVQCCTAEPAIHVLDDYGHLDVLVGSRAADDVFSVVLEWMSERF